MERSERRAAVSAYKERKAVAGMYAIRCAATDEQWVGAAPDLSTIWTRPLVRAAARHRDEPGIERHRQLWDARFDDERKTRA